MDNIEEKKEKVRQGFRVSGLPKGTTVIVSIKAGDKNELVHAEVVE